MRTKGCDRNELGHLHGRALLRGVVSYRVRRLSPVTFAKFVTMMAAKKTGYSIRTEVCHPESPISGQNHGIGQHHGILVHTALKVA